MSADGPPADLVLTGATAITMDPGRPIARAVAVRGAQIVAVGDDADVQPFIGAETRVLHLDGRTLTPGFQDAHVHPPIGGLARMRCNLEGYRARKQLLAAIEVYARSRPVGSWILGGAWWHEAFEDGPPTLDELDQVTGDRPALLPDNNGHTAWVNSAALRLAGLDARTPDPAGGRIDRDEDGSPSGLLQEHAVWLVQEHVPATTHEENLEALLTGQAYLHSVGITSWQDASVAVPEWGESFEAYREMDADGRLTGRAVGALWWFPDRPMDEQVERLLHLRTTGMGERFRPIAIKIMQDGSIINQTAAMLSPLLGADGAPAEETGESMIEPALLAEIVTRLDAEGFQVHFHCIGDRSTREALDAFEAARRANGPSANRHHIAHVQVTDPVDHRRFAQLDVTVNAQFGWGVREPEMDTHYLPALGPQRARYQYAFGSLRDAGARIAAGSDWNVTTADPFPLIEAAVTRCEPTARGEYPPFEPAEALTVDEALQAYTMGSAFVNHQDDRTGSIEVGKLADLTIADRDVFDHGAGPIGDARAVMTIVGGEVVWSDGSLD